MEKIAHDKGREIRNAALITHLFNADHAQLPSAKAECLRNAYLLLQNGEIAQEYKDWYSTIQSKMPAHLAIPPLQ